MNVSSCDSRFVPLRHRESPATVFRRVGRPRLPRCIWIHHPIQARANQRQNNYQRTGFRSFGMNITPIQKRDGFHCFLGETLRPQFAGLFPSGEGAIILLTFAVLFASGLAAQTNRAQGTLPAQQQKDGAVYRIGHVLGLRFRSHVPATMYGPNSRVGLLSH